VSCHDAQENVNITFIIYTLLIELYNAIEIFYSRGYGDTNDACIDSVFSSLFSHD
jgi:hypothetical protein